MSNYSEEETEMMIHAYEERPTRETVEKLSQELNRSIKSVIGKLSREGVYRREKYVTKTGDKPVTKLEIVAMIADELGVETENLSGLEKAPKNVLKIISKAVAGLSEDENYTTSQLEMAEEESNQTTSPLP